MRGKYILPHRSKLTVCSSWVPLSRWMELTTTEIPSRLLLSPTLTLIFHIHVQTENSKILYCITKSVALKSNTNIRRRSTPVSGADLGGGCRGCAPPPPEMPCGFLIQLVLCQKKKKKKQNDEVYWCWSRAKDECTPSLKESSIRPWVSLVLRKSVRFFRNKYIFNEKKILS